MITEKYKNKYLKNPLICKCGCGEIISFDQYLHHRNKKYINGHHVDRKGSNNPNYGHKTSEKTKKLISLGQVGKKYWFRDIENYPEARKKLSDSYKNRNLSSDPEIKKKMLETKRRRGSSISGGVKAAETAKRNGTKTGGRCKWIQIGDKKVQGKFELKFAQFLDEIKVDWISHKDIETFRYIGLDGNEKKLSARF